MAGLNGHCHDALDRAAIDYLPTVQLCEGVTAASKAYLYKERIADWLDGGRTRQSRESATRTSRAFLAICWANEHWASIREIGDRQGFLVQRY